MKENFKTASRALNPQEKKMFVVFILDFGSIHYSPHPSNKKKEEYKNNFKVFNQPNAEQWKKCQLSPAKQFFVCGCGHILVGQNPLFIQTISINFRS